MIILFGMMARPWRTLFSIMSMRKFICYFCFFLYFEILKAKRSPWLLYPTEGL